MGRRVLEGVLVIFEYLLVEDIVDVGGEVGSEMAGDQHTSLLVQDVDGRDATHSNNYDLNYAILLPEEVPIIGELTFDADSSDCGPHALATSFLHRAEGTAGDGAVGWLSVFEKQLDFQPSHGEVVAGVGLVRLDDVAQLAEADCAGQFFEGGLFDAELNG